MSRSRRNTRRQPVSGRPIEILQLERRVMLCGLHMDHLIAPPAFDWVVEEREAMRLSARGGPEATSIVWSNRGQAGDGFAANFGTSANAGRAVVDAVLDYWENIITNWNRFDGTTTLQVNISITNSNGFGAAAAPNSLAPLDGKPRTGSITLQRGNNSADPNDSNGWFFDPTPFDSSEFLGDIINAYAGVNSAGVGNDFFSVVSAELAHVLGLISDRSNNGGGFQGYLLENFATDTGIADNAEGNGNGNFWIFEGPTIDHLMTSFNSGDPNPTSWGNVVHTAGVTAAGINFDGRTWFGSDDTGNAIYGNERTLPSFVMTMILKDAYGYTVNDPMAFGHFHAVLNETSGALRVRGGSVANSHDVITVTRSGTQLTVSVDVGNDVAGTGALPGAGNLPAYVTTFDSSDVTSIQIDAGDGNDTIIINSIQSNIPIVINAGAGNDTIHIAEAGDNLDVIDSNITVNGGTGTDILRMFDESNGFGDTFTITNNSIGRNAFPTLSYSGLETVIVNAGGGSSTFNVLSSPSGTSIAVFAGAGDDTFNVGNGGTVASVLGSLNLVGQGGTDTLNYNDSSNGSSGDYTVNGGGISRTGIPNVGFGTMENLNLNAAATGNTITVAAVGSGVSLVVNGGGGNDNLVLGSIGGLANIAGSVSYSGGTGTDTLTIVDTANSSNSTHTITQSSYSRTGFAGVPFDTIEHIVVSGGSGSNTYNIDPTPVSLTAAVTINAGSGNDAFRITPTANNAQFVGGTLNLNGGAGADSFTLFDSSSTASMPYNISTSAVIRGVQTMNYSSVSTMTIHGTSGANAFSVSSLSANATLNGNNGNDSLILGGAGQNLDGITGSVMFNGGSGTDTIELRDQQNPDNDNYSIDSTSVARAGFGGVSWGTSESLSVEGGSGNNTFQLLSASIPVALNGNGGNDHFAIGGSVQAVVGTNFTGNVTVAGGTGTDTVSVFDNNGTGTHTYTVQAGLFDKTSFSSLSYGGVENFNLNANDSSNIVNLESFNSGMNYVVNGSGGSDTFNLAQPSGQLGSLPSPVTINGGLGTDQILLFDGNNAAGSDYTVTSSTVSRPGFGGLTYASNNESLFIAAGTGNDAFIIDSADIPMTVAGGNGDDKFVVGGGDVAGNITSLVRVLAGGGDDLLTIDDSGTSAANDYTFDASGFSMTGSTNISYDSIEALNVEGSQGNNNFNVREAAATTSLALDGNGGSDVFHLGSLANRLNTIAAPVNINGGAGSDSLIVNDQGDAGSFGFTVSSNSITRAGAGPVTYSNIGAITINAGNATGGGNKTHDVLSLGSADLLLNAGIGSDTIRVSSVSQILGSSGGDMSFNGQGGNDRLVLNDGSNAADETYFVASQFTENSGGRLFHYDNLEVVEINGGAGASAFNVASLLSTMSLTLDGGAGADTFALGSGNTVDALDGAISITGGGGDDSITVNDTANASANGFTLTPTSFTRTGMGTISYGTVEQITINSGGGSTKQHAINGTAAGTPVRLNPGPNRDIIVVSETAATGPVTIGASGGADSVDINLDNTGAAHVIFDEAITLGGLRFGNGGTAEVVAGGANVLRSFGLTIAAGSKLDLNDNPMIIDYSVGSPLTTVRNRLTSGYNGGTWTGNGIMSSTAAATPGYALGYAEASALFSAFPATFSGQSVDNTTVLIDYTRYGDANLDRQVNLADFNRMASNFGTNGGWSEGNFNYDSAINLADFNLLASNFGQSAGVTAGRGGEELPAIETLVFGDVPITVA